MELRWAINVTDLRVLSWKILTGRGPLGDLDVDGRIILKRNHMGTGWILLVM